MKKSSMVQLGLVLLLAACKEDKTYIKHCVDEKGIVVDEKYCNGGTVTDGGIVYHEAVTEQTPGAQPTVRLVRWHYDDVYVPIGNMVWSGSYYPVYEPRVYVSHTYYRTTVLPTRSTGGGWFSRSYGGGVSAPAPSVSRGGFGSTGAHFGGVSA